MTFAEQIFSYIGNIKTKLHNKMSLVMLDIFYSLYLKCQNKL